MSETTPFSTNYTDARARFLAAAEAAGGRLSHYTNPHATGPAGEPLVMDTAWFGPTDAPAVMLNTCGTHGAEGFAGSAAQLDWLENGGPASLPAETAVLLVHAVNPYGFAWCLRGTENNVDLNRNWLDHDKPHPANPLYEEIHGLLCPKRIDRKAIQRLLEEGARLIAEHGQWAVEDAISRGQYSHPDGFHYGGTQMEWSTRTLKRIVETDMGSAERVAFIDWHTGPVGDGELIFLCFSPPNSPGFRQAESWWGPDALNADQVDALWGSKRPTRRGILFWGIEQTLRPGTSFAGAVVEFRSSLPKRNAADALRVSMLERWLRFEGGFDAPEAADYFDEIREDYAPARESFRHNVIANARATYAKTLSGLAHWRVADAAD
ncbi:MAG: M14 family metallopeptidase [Parvibaculaceae bacterium]